MAKITITVEGDPQELRQTLLGLLNPSDQDEHGHMQVPSVKSAAEETVSASPSGFDDTLQWSPDLFREFWKSITVNAKEILTEIARHPEGIDMVEIREKFGIRPKDMGGRLSAVGFAMRRIEKRHKKNRPEIYPFEPDYPASMYRMHPDFARMVLEAAAPTQES